MPTNNSQQNEFNHQVTSHQSNRSCLLLPYHASLTAASWYVSLLCDQCFGLFFDHLELVLSLWNFCLIFLELFIDILGLLIHLTFGSFIPFELLIQHFSTWVVSLSNLDFSTLFFTVTFHLHVSILIILHFVCFLSSHPSFIYTIPYPHQALIFSSI